MKTLGNPFKFKIDPEITIDGWRDYLQTIDWYFYMADDYRAYQRGEAQVHDAREFAEAHDNPEYLVEYEKARKSRDAGGAI